MAQIFSPFSMDEQAAAWTPERMQQLAKIGSSPDASPVCLYRDTETTAEKEWDVQMLQNSFLERLDNRTHGMPPWYLEYCDAHDPRHADGGLGVPEVPLPDKPGDRPEGGELLAAVRR